MDTVSNIGCKKQFWGVCLLCLTASELAATEINDTSSPAYRKVFCFILFCFMFNLMLLRCLKTALVRAGGLSLHLGLIHPSCGLQGCNDTQLNTCMFFPVVGSTIRRCTKLYALSHLPWALERTARTGWHARFGSPMSTNPPFPHSASFVWDPS